MKTFKLIFLWLLLSGFSPGQQVILNNPQLRSDNASAGLPATDDNFTASGYPLAGGNCAEWGHRIPCNNHISTTRAQTVLSYCTAMDGMLVSTNANVARLCNGNGLLIEEARTNSALWARDMTNAAWVKVGMGNALNATGADGVANSATTLTATGTASSCTASCTILQTLTLGSTADTYSVYLKRVTGSGAVNITINNLVGTTACTLVTTSFTRCTITATLANPVIGIQLTALNDVVTVDFNQLEAGSFVTSAIPTTTVAATRAADNVTAAGTLDALFRSGKGSSIIQFTGSAISPSGLGRVYDQNNGQLTSQIQIGAGSSMVEGAASITTATSYTINTLAKQGVSWDVNTLSGVLNNGAVATSAGASFTPGATTIGNRADLTRSLNGFVIRVTEFSARIPDATLKAMTQ
jgi:hypothetical protein